MEYVNAGAQISFDKQYRYHLWREWRGTRGARWKWLHADGTWKDSSAHAVTDGAGEPLGQPRSVMFAMLNPSTADGTRDDPTIRRCVSFCRRWGYERLDVVNLFAFRATKPAQILKAGPHIEIVGYDNQRIVEKVASDADLIVCAWGAHGSHLGQDETFRGWLMGLPREAPQMALGFTAGGQPRHPLYVASAATLVAMPS